MASTAKVKSISCKVLIVGKSCVGKSFILLQYTNPQQGSILLPQMTVTLDYKTATEKVEDNEVKMSIWDTAGQEKFRPIIQTFFKNSKAAVFVFDLTDKQSLTDIKYWLKEVKLKADKNISKILVGNKCDLPHEQPDQVQIKEYCEENDMEYIETSALNRININEVFSKLARKIFEQNKLNNTTIQKLQTNTQCQIKEQSSISNDKNIELNKEINNSKQNESCC